jgi:phage FluMu protein Com
MDHEHTPAVHCAACSRLVTIPADAKSGDEVTCPFCGTVNRLKELTVLTAEAADAGE